MQITAEILDGVERRTAYLLAGLEASDESMYKFNAQTGKSEHFRKPPELPSGRALLVHLLRDGHRVTDRSVVIAKEAAVCELLLARSSEGEGNN